MKRVYLLLFTMILLPFVVLADETVQKNLTIMLGTSVTVNPFTDAINAEWNDAYAVQVNSAAANNYEKYYIVSSSDLSVTATAQRSGSLTLDYYIYTLTPAKTGTYSFSVRLHWTSKNYMYDYAMGETTVIYLINVVDLKSISIPSTLSLPLGDTYTFFPVFTDAGATTTLTWQSSNTSVATINEEGTLTTTGIGKTTVTCTAHNGVSAQCEVTVNPVLVEKIALSETEAELTVGEKLQLKETIAPENATDKSVTWSSTNEAVALVNESGLVTAVGSGTCQIKATANDGSGKTASCLVTVEKNNKLTVTDMTQCSGGRGVLNVLLTDEETIMGFQFDLELPAGVTVAEKEGQLMTALTGNAINTHTITSNKVSEGLYRFVVTPQGSRAISNADGGGMTITIDVADNVSTGTYTMSIKDIEMTVKKAGNVYEDIHPKNSTATLTITEATMGDVNGDGRVSVTDVISMNSYILEEEPAQFIRKVADLNGDGKVTITDMVKVIDIILGR